MAPEEVDATTVEVLEVEVAGFEVSAAAAFAACCDNKKRPKNS